MSYVVHVWEKPLPQGFEDAVAIRSRLLREGGAPSTAFAALARRLTERFPDIGAFDEDDDPGVWTDGPLANNARSSVFGIGVQTHALDVVVPFVVEAAGELGLVVLDEQSGHVYLPGGRVQAPGGRPSARTAPSPSFPSRQVSRADILPALHRVLGPGLISAGFRPVAGDAHYRYVASSAAFEVQFIVESAGNGQTVGVHTQAILPGRIEDPLVQHLYPEGTMLALHAHRLATAAGRDWPGAIASSSAQTHVETQEDLERLAAHWRGVFEDAIVPLVRRCESLEGLEREMTERPDAFAHPHAALALAAAVGREDLEQVVHGVIPRLARAWHAHLAEQLVYLRSPPVFDPGLPLAAADAAAVLAALGTNGAKVLPRLGSGRPRLPVGSDGRLLPVDQQPVIANSSAGLYALCVVERVERFDYLQQGQLREAGLAAKDLLALAVANLGVLASASLQRTSKGGLDYLRLDGRLESSLMLLDGLWDDELAAATPNGALVAIPAPNVLAFCDVAAPGGIQALRALLPPMAGPATTFTRSLYYRRDRQWEALPPRPTA